MVALVISVSVLLIGSTVFAQWQGGHGAQRMSCQERFDALDSNHDGKLTKEEFMAVPHHRRNPEEMFRAMDVDGHGYVTKDEFCSGRGRGRHGMGTGEDQ
jgi:Ca2+-binding EF-hand superfamily protein